MLKKILLFLLLICFSSIPAFAENFYINNYDVKIKVNNDKSIDVVENIDTYFTKSSHGIYRTIPLKGNRIKNITSSDGQSVNYTGNDVVIRVGDPNKYVSGNKSYKIAYTYIITDNKNDEFYFNIIGTEWNVPINRATFNVAMPKQFDSKKVGLSIGSYGTKGFSGNAAYYVENNNIIGNTTEVLFPRQGITIRIALPKGYFSASINYEKCIIMALILLLTGLSYFLWSAVGKDKPIIPIVTFYPPKNINSAEAEAIYNEECVTTKGLTSLLIYLADKGYLRIIDNGWSFALEKLKEYDGDNIIESMFLDALFFNRTYVGNHTLLSSKVFYQECQNIMSKASDLTTEQFYEKESISSPIVSISFILLFSVIMLSLYVLSNYNFSFIISNFFKLLFPIIAICMIFLTKSNSLFLYVWALGFGGIPLLSFIQRVPRYDTNYNIAEVIIYVLCIIICGVCLRNLPRKNNNGHKTLRELYGLKKFIEVAEKRRLQTLVNANPEYFYNILPYAYIFGISDAWIKKFEPIMKLSPAWYQGESFTIHRFNNLTRTMGEATQPSTTNGGISTSSSGGGGFSGGGHGGGGGGSW